MATDTLGILERLAPEERGLVLGLSLLGAGDSPAPPLGGARNADILLAWQSLRAEPGEVRAALEARLQEEIASHPIPALARLHPTWIAAAIMDQPVALWEILLQGLPKKSSIIAALPNGHAAEHKDLRLVASAAGESEVRELQRCTFAELSPLLAEPCGPLGLELCALELDALLTRVVRAGAWEVGRSLAKAPPAVVVRAMATVGDPWASDLARAAREPVSPEQRSRAAALVAAASGVRPGSAGEWGPVHQVRPDDRLAAVGLLALRDRLAAEGHASLCAVAGRLPMALGRAWVNWSTSEPLQKW